MLAGDMQAKVYIYNKHSETIVYRYIGWDYLFYDDIIQYQIYISYCFKMSFFHSYADLFV